MKAVAGILTFEQGMVEVFGEKLVSERAANRIKSRIGFMPQGLGLNLYPELSVEENIDFFGNLRLVPGEELKRRKDKFLRMTRLDSFRARKMKNLSGGMKQKLGLVCTLIHEPDLLILDEPTTGVDPVSRRDFWTILAELLKERDITALVSTAYMDEAMRFDRLALMYKGRILASGGPEEVVEEVQGTLLVIWTRHQMETPIRVKQIFPLSEVIGDTVRVFAKGMEPRKARVETESILMDIKPDKILVDTPGLEDVFMAMILERNGPKRELVSLSQHVKQAKIDSSREEKVQVAVHAQELVRDFGKFRAVDHITFTVRQGEIFGLLGANGAGKTTVIKMLTGIIRPTSGQGMVAGADMRKAGSLIKERIGYMSQAFSLYLDLTVIENIHLFCGIYGLSSKDTRQRAAWVIEMAGLKGFQTIRTGKLPMGVRQRLALGCALVHSPKVLFLDEPTSGVDPVGRRRFWDILLDLSRNHSVAILITTHYMSEAEHCDRLALMHGGRIIADSSPSALKKGVEDEAGILLEVVTDAPIRTMDTLGKNGFSNLALFGKRVHLLTHRADDARTQIPQILAREGIRAELVQQRPLTMEDVFIYRILAAETKANRPV